MFPRLALSIVLLAATPIFAQDAAPGATTPAKPAEKAKPLSSQDKSFVKNSLESMYLLMNLSDKKKRESLKVTEANAVGEKISTEMTKLWEQLAPMATANGDKLPEAVPNSDKSKIERLNKAPGDKFDKEWIKLVGKETKHLATAFTAGKSAQNAELKALAMTWEPTLKSIDDETNTAEKAVAKAK